MSEAPPPPNRAVISDDGASLRLLVYSGGVVEPVAVVELSPEAAVRLCGELATVAHRHMVHARYEQLGVRTGPAQ